MVRAFYRWVINHPVAALVLTLLVSSVFAAAAAKAKVDNSIEALFVESDPTVQAFRDFTDIFGSSEIAAIAFKDDKGIFRRENLELIQRITERVEMEVPHVEQVVSLTNASLIRGEEGAIFVEPFMDEIPDNDTAAMQELAARATAEKLFRKVLISEDGKTTSIVVKTEYISGDDKYREKITHKIRTIVAEENQELQHEFSLGGPPIFMTVFNEYILQDIIKLGPATALLLTILLFLTFRHWNGLVVPMTTVFVGLIWTIGFMTMIGKKVNLATTIIPPLILVIGVANVVHLINIFNHELSLGKEKKQAVLDTLMHLGTPMFIASLSTCIGFLSLGVSEISVIRETGIIAGFGVMATLLISLVIPPVILLWAKPSAKLVDDYKHRVDEGLIGTTLDTLHIFNERHPKIVLSIGLAIMLFFCMGIPRINVETSFIKYFKQDSEIVQAQTFIQDNLSGVAPLEILVDAGDKGLKDPQVLREIEAIQNHLQSEGLVDHSMSPVDFLKILRQAFYNGETTAYAIPNNPEEIAQLFLVYDLQGGGAGLEDFRTDNYRYGRISSRLQDAGTNALAGVINRTQAVMDQSTSGANYRFADNTNMIVHIVDNLIWSQAESLLLAFALIFFMMWWFIKTVKHGLLAMIPNIFPITVVLGTMGYMGIDLNVSTVMVPAIALGLAVDDTVHLFSRFAQQYEIFGDRVQAARETIHSTGRACLYTSVNLCAGFVVLGLSNFYPNLYFGLLSAATVAAAVISDLTITMAILRLWGPESTR